MTNAAIVVKNREQGKSESAKNSTTRVFFALWPDADLRAALYELARQQQSAYGGRIMRAETLHLTLLFLGDVPAEKMAGLQQAASAVRAPAFSMEIDQFAGWCHNGIGYAAPAILPQALLELNAQLCERMADTGLRFDRKDFQPHVTLLRNLERVPQMRPIALPAWAVREFALVKSVLGMRGAYYEVVRCWPLGPV